MKFRLKYTEELTREAVVEADSLIEAKEKLGTNDVEQDKAVDTECYFGEAEEIERC